MFPKLALVRGLSLLRCEHYARCVSLYGDGFDSLFDDNFFDLLPGETKCIRVLPSPSSGVIYAETAYDQTVVSCQWKPANKKSSPKWDLLQGNLAEGGEKEVQHK